MAIAYPILQIERSRALTRLNFLLTFRVLSGDRSYIAADQIGGTRTPCSRRNAPTILIASATKRPRVSSSASPSRAAILRSNTIDVPLATSAQVNVRARNGVTFRFPRFRSNIAQFCGSEMGSQPVFQSGTGPIGRIRANAANNDIRQGVDGPLDVAC
jgi:hypothetical protein